MRTLKESNYPGIKIQIKTLRISLLKHYNNVTENPCKWNTVITMKTLYLPEKLNVDY